MTSNSEDLSKLLCSLQAQCVKREYCISDIRQKARKALIDRPMEEIEDVVSSLVNDGFVDDKRFATAFARDKSSLTGWGPAKIRTALLTKGIDRSIINEALEEIDEVSANNKMEKVVSSKWKFLKDDPYGKFKLIKYALSRGYEYDSVNQLVNRIISNSSED